MNKPDDVSQEDWDASNAALYGSAADDDLQTLIARAIMAARLQEREAIIDIVNEAGVKPWNGNTTEQSFAGGSVRFYTCQGIAQAIRKRK